MVVGVGYTAEMGEVGGGEEIFVSQDKAFEVSPVL